MTRAVQTLSVLLLVSSVCYGVPPPQERSTIPHGYYWQSISSTFPFSLDSFPWTRLSRLKLFQLYVTHPVNSPIPELRMCRMKEKLTYIQPAPILRAYCLCLLPPRPPRCRDLHLQWRTRGTRWATKGDRACQGGVAPGQGWGRLIERWLYALVKTDYRTLETSPVRQSLGLGLSLDWIMPLQDWKGCAGSI